MGLFGVLLLGRNDRRKKIAHAVLAIAMVAFLLLAGCSGTSAGVRQSPGVSNTTPLLN